MKTRHRYAPAKEKIQTAKAKPQSEPTEAMSAGGVIIGRLVELDDQGPSVAYDLDSVHVPQRAISVVPLAENQIGHEVVLSFAGNRDNQPIIMGVVQSRLAEQTDIDASQEKAANTQDESPELLINGDKINISAAKEITLKCGKSSITLTEKGKILIKGEHILSRAAGANRVRGGSIQLN